MNAIEVDNISKQYRLGTFSSRTLTQDVNRWWALLRGKEDPFTSLGQTNIKEKKRIGEYIWALKDINFDVKQGEVFGFIGKNGAGKSTLLKILSRITGPTSGRIRAKGRIASLLEVGTGFHPELTGRENTYLNGAILGMTKSEIADKFDEIVEFADISRFIDTPVKRYSSGMYVRLAFAVAAHLEPEILIIDEVLAVGDSEFQTKALGKMKEVSLNSGRTVLFVSHNMGAVEMLCDRAILLENGTMASMGKPDSIIQEYLSKVRNENQSLMNFQTKFHDSITVNDFKINGSKSLDVVIKANEFSLDFSIKFSLSHPMTLSFFIQIFDHFGTLFGSFHQAHENSGKNYYSLEKGDHEIEGTITFPRLNAGKFLLSFGLGKSIFETFCLFEKAIKLTVNGFTSPAGLVFKQATEGYIMLEGKTNLKPL